MRTYFRNKFLQKLTQFYESLSVYTGKGYVKEMKMVLFISLLSLLLFYTNGHTWKKILVIIAFYFYWRMGFGAIGQFSA